MSPVAGKIAVVTGAGSGIGLAAAHALATAGEGLRCGDVAVDVAGAAIFMLAPPRDVTIRDLVIRPRTQPI